MKFVTAGESHGPALITVVENLPAGVPVTEEYVNRQLKRRQEGYGRGGRMKIESDRVRFLSGVRGGFTLGSPVAMQIENRDWANWSGIMDPGPEALTGDRVVTRPRPGHADLPGAIKYGHRDIRNVLERASARETAARVAAGSLARRLLEELGVTVLGAVIRIGSVTADFPDRPPAELTGLISQSSVGCADPEAEQAMRAEIDRAREDGDSLGGVFEIRVYGLPPGIGSYASWDMKLDGRLAGAVMSIQAIKGVEVGLGFEAAQMPGSRVHDEIYYEKGLGFYRKTNRAGGIEGGMTNGGPVVVRAAMKPIPTLYKPLKSVDIVTKEPFEASVERSDVCAVPAARVVGEAVVAWEIAGACLEKLGGDTMDEIKARWAAYGEKARCF
ncbi:MAG: chorismate synthase [Peptococcaceae bacterium]|nr:chorismate synthase [Peptococcaceae bacterium]